MSNGSNNKIKIINWQFQKRPNQPAYYTNKRVYKVFTSGLLPSEFVELMNLIWEYPQHSFLVVDSNPDAFWNLPPNVTPMLHIDSPVEFAEKEQYFKEVVQGRESAGLSIYFNKGDIIPKLKWDIVLINGFAQVPMLRCVKDCSRRGVNCYVESFQFGKPIPVEMNYKLLPPTVTAQTVASNLFLYNFRDVNDCDLKLKCYPEAVL